MGHFPAVLKVTENPPQKLLSFRSQRILLYKTTLVFYDEHVPLHMNIIYMVPITTIINKVELHFL